MLIKQKKVKNHLLSLLLTLLLLLDKNWNIGKPCSYQYNSFKVYTFFQTKTCTRYYNYYSVIQF